MHGSLSDRWTKKMGNAYSKGIGNNNSEKHVETP